MVVPERYAYSRGGLREARTGSLRSFVEYPAILEFFSFQSL
jgi:hypothetical protein